MAASSVTRPAIQEDLNEDLHKTSEEVTVLSKQVQKLSFANKALVKEVSESKAKEQSSVKDLLKTLEEVKELGATVAALSKEVEESKAKEQSSAADVQELREMVLNLLQMFKQGSATVEALTNKAIESEARDAEMIKLSKLLQTQLVESKEKCDEDNAPNLRRQPASVKVAVMTSVGSPIE